MCAEFGDHPVVKVSLMLPGESACWFFEADERTAKDCEPWPSVKAVAFAAPIPAVLGLQGRRRGSTLR